MNKQIKFNAKWVIRGMFFMFMLFMFLAIIAATALFIQGFLDIHG